MRVLIDVMSGDCAPREQIKGLLMANRLHPEHTMIAVGNRETCASAFTSSGENPDSIEWIDALDVITMHDDPMSIRREKSESSMAVGLKKLADGVGDAFVSAGNTGALFTGATLYVRKIKGVRCASIGALIYLKKPLLLIDSGANLAVTEQQLEQFAVMGSAYCRSVLGMENPSVGLLNNGAESSKGTEIIRRANALLTENVSLHFVGNVEPNTAILGGCDVLVADGFTGNIFLKSIEGLGALLLGDIKSCFLSSPMTKIGGALVKGKMKTMLKKYDTREYGGAPILGIAKPVIKAHGNSDAYAFCQAIGQAIKYSESETVRGIADAVAELKEESNHE